MGDPGPALPSHEARRDHVLDALATCFGRDVEPIRMLPVERCRAVDVRGPLRLETIQIPHWARGSSVDGRLLVPVESAPVNDWRQVDWWTAAFLLLEGWHERTWERRHGPIHSYALRLDGWDTRAWDHAWVNRIGLFLRAWAGLDAPIRPADLRLSHDVDALRKTVPIRIKQGAMRGALAVTRRPRSDSGRSSTWQFAFGRGDWYTIDDVVRMEHERGVNATFNLFADPRPRTPRRWLMDPGYRLDSEDGRRLLSSLEGLSNRVGLHPSFDSWEDDVLLAEQKRHLERHTNAAVTSVRQHWLRFSWDRTWRAQSAAGLSLDATLMFNDRSGFRNSAALEWHPWDVANERPHSIRAVPCCFMDSHAYDYAALAGDRTVATAASLISECRSVGGVAELLWHPHTLTDDYGWRDGFESLLDAVAV